MNWYKISSINEFTDKIKNILKNDKLTQKLLSYYSIPISDIDNHLRIEIADLGDKFAEGNSTTIYLDKKLITDSFFDNNFHFVIHEFWHWIKRRSEKDFYFNDPEEIQSFVLAIVWELRSGKNRKQVEQTLYPIIDAHFKDKKEAQKLFIEMLEEAARLANIS
jgi:hypothetical protein